MRTQKISKPQLRSFGLIVAAGFAVIGLWPAVFHSRTPRMWALALAVVLSVLA